MMVFVIVVMACCAKAQSAILRLFLAMRMLRVLTAMPKPFKSAWEKPIVRVDCTAGLKKFSVEFELLRVLFQLMLRFVPVSKFWEYCVLNWVVWLTRFNSPATPVPEMNGLLTGVKASLTPTLPESVGSYERLGRFAVEELKLAPGVE